MDLLLNCSVSYHPNFLAGQTCGVLYRELTEVHGIATYRQSVPGPEGDSLTDHGKIMFVDDALRTPRHFPEAVWGKTAAWPAALREVGRRIEQLTGRRFAVCVAIYYPDGNAGVGYHSDYPAFGDTSLLPSLSIGAERPFLLREKASRKTHRILLGEGSLLVMGRGCQELYEHALPPVAGCTGGRINLTFRPFGF